MANVLHHVDFTNGNDSTKDGHRYPADVGTYTTITGTDGTHIHIATNAIVGDGDADDFLNGDYLYNVTRSLGALVTDYVHNDGTDTVITVAIAGQTVGDTFYVLRSWKTMSKLATTLVAGDTGYIRGGQTHDCSAGPDIDFTNDGAANNYITINGCYTASPDPWVDGAITRPIIDFGDAAYQAVLSGDLYWHIKSLDFKRSADTVGALSVGSGAYGIIVEDCRFYDNDFGSTGIGLNIPSSNTTKVINCTFYDNKTCSLNSTAGFADIIGCVFYGGSVIQTPIGIRGSGGLLRIKDTTFGVGGGTYAHTTADILTNYANNATIIHGRNIRLDSTTPIGTGYYATGGGLSVISFEDFGLGAVPTHLSFKQWQFSGIIQKSTTYNRGSAGGTAWSMLGEANSNCEISQPLYLIGDWLRGMPIYLDGTEQTITVYVLCHDNVSTTYTSADKFTIELEHYESAGVWAIDTSTEDFSAEDVWKAFTITLTPGAAGPAYLKIKLLEYNANHDLYVDPTPVIS